MWHIPSLLVNEIKTIYLETMVDISTPLGYNYHCIAHIQPILNDTIPQNNSDIVSGFITGSMTWPSLPAYEYHLQQLVMEETQDKRVAYLERFI